MAKRLSPSTLETTLYLSNEKAEKVQERSENKRNVLKDI
jgi:hypothetical protein